MYFVHTSSDVSRREFNLIEVQLRLDPDSEFFLPNPIIPHRQMRFTRKKYQMKKLLTFFAPSNLNVISLLR